MTTQSIIGAQQLRLHIEKYEIKVKSYYMIKLKENQEKLSKRPPSHVLIHRRELKHYFFLSDVSFFEYLEKNESEHLKQLSQ